MACDCSAVTWLAVESGVLGPFPHRAVPLFEENGLELLARRVLPVVGKPAGVEELTHRREPTAGPRLEPVLDRERLEPLPRRGDRVGVELDDPGRCGLGEDVLHGLAWHSSEKVTVRGQAGAQHGVRLLRAHPDPRDLPAPLGELGGKRGHSDQPGVPTSPAVRDADVGAGAVLDGSSQGGKIAVAHHRPQGRPEPGELRLRRRCTDGSHEVERRGVLPSRQRSQQARFPAVPGNLGHQRRALVDVEVWKGEVPRLVRRDLGDDLGVLAEHLALKLEPQTARREPVRKTDAARDLWHDLPPKA